MVVGSQWHGSGDAYGFVVVWKNPTDQDCLLSIHQLTHRFTDKNVDFMREGPHFFRAQYVEPCQHSGSLQNLTALYMMGSR